MNGGDEHVWAFVAIDLVKAKAFHLASSDKVSPTGRSSETVHFGTFFGGRSCRRLTRILYVHPTGYRLRRSSPSTSLLPRTAPAGIAFPCSPLLSWLAFLVRRSLGPTAADALPVDVGRNKKRRAGKALRLGATCTSTCAKKGTTNREWCMTVENSGAPAEIKANPVVVQSVHGSIPQ